MTWITLAILAVGTFGLRVAGPRLLGRRELPPRARNVMALVPVAILAGLVALQGAGGDVDSARLAGLCAAALALLLRADLLVAVVAAAATAAVLRAVG